MNITPVSMAICNQKGSVGKSTSTVLLASHLHYTLRHDVLIADCDYQSSDMRAVEQTPVGCRPGRRKPPFPTVASSKMPGMEIRKARPLGRFAWPCGFSAPAFNSLPAERDYKDISDFFAFKGETIYAVLTWFRIVFPNSPLFLYSHEFIRQLLFEHLHFPIDHRLGDLGVGLRRGDAFMSQHLRERFQRYAVHQADRRGIGVASLVEYTRQSKRKRTGEN